MLSRLIRSVGLKLQPSQPALLEAELGAPQEPAKPKRPIEPVRTTVVHPGSDGRGFPLLADLIDAFSGEPAPQLLIFGDSVLERVSRHDANHRTLASMVSGTLPTTSHIATRTALNPALMLALLRTFRLLAPPKVVMLPVNLRCFSPQWDGSPAWAMHQELGIIEGWLSNPDQPIAPLLEIRKTPDLYTSYHNTPVTFELSKLETIGAFREVTTSTPIDEAAVKARKREIFVFHYGHRLVPSHRQLIDLNSAVQVCRSIGAAPVVYVTPINMEAATRHCGPRLAEIVADNVAFVRETLAPLVKVADWSNALPAGDFFKEDLATEHLAQSGREKLAARIIDAIMSVLPASRPA
jgi:hypothetical protein